MKVPLVIVAPAKDSSPQVTGAMRVAITKVRQRCSRINPDGLGDPVTAAQTVE
jgi:hypothetical protein